LEISLVSAARGSAVTDPKPPGRSGHADALHPPPDVLFDLPEAPRPPEDTLVPVRFVADFDNLILSHADRTRIIADEHRPEVITNNGQVLPTFLVDGFVAGTWKVSRVRKRAMLTVSPFAPLSSAAKSALAAEGEGLARFLQPDADQFDLHFEA
jgi:hypothetical protein